MKINSYGIGNIENIKKIEEEFGINLPEDYKIFLINNNGGEVDDAYFYVNDISQKIMMGLFYGVDLEKNAANIIKINKEYEDDILDNSLLIGGDAGGGWILLVFDGESDGIWYYDHSYFFEESTDELNTYFICDTFTEFLEMLKNTKL
ncbi:SMI1/KNR4 family protein [Flavobacterium sp. LS1R47]|uniref:SMI1/KNR4 family protein n=1 Tax=Flavobacterium frigoritolerans TaxID=2987686 RepID=A0A9X3HMS2_9FLAO|nr:SMI1/KNR4 family protein [Flavobacterium frigoritolerans]MCV9934089.1 SMI1/KNR4 family protein [Flavobacterium frigoritolerans]